MLYIPRSADVAFNLRIADTSRLALTAGTEIPVVRANDFYTTTVAFLNVPLNDESRVALRIYDPDRREGSAFRVRVYSEENSVPLSEFAVRTETGGAPPTSAPDTPGFAEIYELRNLLGPLPISRDSVDILIDPISPGIRFWAFAAVTNNSTQQVTTVSPQ